MEPVGFCGIIKLTTQILHRNLKHFLCIAFILVLQAALLLAVTPSSSNTFQSLAHSISLLYNYAFHSKTVPSPDPYTPTQPQHLLLLITIFVVSIFFSLLLQPPLTFSVCRAVLNKSLDLKSSLLAVPRSALNLILTVLCIAGVLLGFMMAMMMAMIISVVAVLAIGVDSFILVVVMIWSVVTVGGCFYLGMAWSLASTVAILEEKRGWEAMKRSMYLVDGSKWVVFSLGLVLGGCMMFLPITASDEASVMWRWSCMVSSVGLQAMIGLFSMASTVVLYLSCKSRFNEPLDTLITLTPQFSPLETSAKYMDLDSARFDIA